MSTTQPAPANPAPKPNLAAEIGKRVHTLMWDKRVKNNALGVLLGIDSTAVGKKLRAEQKFSIEQLAIVADYLDTTVAYLVGETTVPTKPRPVGPVELESTTSSVESRGLALVTPIRRHA